MAPQFPAAGKFNIGSTQSPPASNADIAQRFDDWLGATKRLLGGAIERTVAITNGSVTPPGNTAVLIIDTQAGAAADDLDVVNPANFHDGAIICVQSADASRVVTIRHAQGSNASLATRNQQSIVLRTTSQKVFFQLASGRAQWKELFRIYGNNAADARTDLGLSSAATYPVASVGEAFDLAASDRLLTPARLGDALLNKWFIDRLEEESSRLADTWFVVSRPDALYKMDLQTLLAATSTRQMVSGELSVTVGTQAAFPHFLEGFPKVIYGVLRCVATDLGYNPGVEMHNFTGISYGADSVNFVYTVGDTPQIAVRGGGSMANITTARWRLLLKGFN